MEFIEAVREKAKIKIALEGPSGSGKTLSALLIARGLVGPEGRIAVGDTENRSANLYANHKKFPQIGKFYSLDIDPPYTMDKYLTAIRCAQEKQFDVLVLDSISHAWAGKGGLLDKKAQMDSRGGNSFMNWQKITPEQEEFMAAILQADIHIIANMRSKQDFALQADDKGKTQVKKMGMAPIQREGTEYEFTTVLDLAMDHSASASKDRTGLFDGKLFIPSIETGEQFKAWLDEGAAAPAPLVASPVDLGESIFEDYAVEIQSCEMNVLPKVLKELQNEKKLSPEQKLKLQAIADRRPKARTQAGLPFST